MKWVFLSCAIFLEVIATSALKLSQGFSKLIPSIIVVIGYGGAFFFLSLALKYIAVGIAYALWAGLGTVFIALMGLLFFKQTLDFFALLGLAFILVGVLIINLFSKSLSS